MRQLKHIRYASQRYTMSTEESAQWDRSDDTERRELLGLLAERLTEATADDAGCRCLFYHANGTLVAKSVHHEPLFENS
jgi:hypothetical protein